MTEQEIKELQIMVKELTTESLKNVMREVRFDSQFKTNDKLMVFRIVDAELECRGEKSV